MIRAKSQHIPARMTLRSPEGMMSHTEWAETSEWPWLTVEGRVQGLRKGAYAGTDTLYMDRGLTRS